MNYEEKSTCSTFKPEDYAIEKLILPRDYIDPSEGFDIGLIKLCQNVPLSKERTHIRTICLPVEESQQIDNLEEEDQILTVAGWGYTETSTELQDVLLKTSVPYLPNINCSEKLGRIRYKGEILERIVEIGDNQMCAGGKNQSDSCKGDSGSGLIGFAELNDRPRMFQHGIVSYGTDCAKNKIYPAVYTRISKFIGWILDNINEK